MSSVAAIERGAVQLDKLVKDRAKLSDPPPLKALSVDELVGATFAPKEVFLHPWLRQKDLAMIHAWRGVGKTHFALGVAYAVASGGTFLDWKAGQARRVLYIDGEMPAITVQERLRAIVKANDEAPPEGFLRFLIADTQERGIPDIATADGQARIDALIGDAEVIVLDNLSCLVRSGVENEGESWLPVAEWALRMRREGRTVVFIHHSNKNGAQRGTSRREDILDVVINLRHPKDYRPEEGARFEVIFEKARGLRGADVQGIEAKLSDVDGRQVWTNRDAESATFDRVLEMSRHGMTPGEIAQELGINKSTVSRHQKRARDERKLS